jgi:hypothetical protein
MTVLLGIAALSLDASFMYDKRNRLQAAADAAAKSAAIELVRNSAVTLTSLRAFANQQVLRHGFSPGGTTSVVVNNPPSSGTYAGDSHYVEVIVSEPTSTFFAKMLGFTSMTPGAKAVAGIGNPTNCLTINGNLAIGNTTLTLSGCGVGIGGDLSGTNPNATITGSPLPSVGVTGTCSGTCGSMGVLTTGAPAPTDPLSGLVAPTNPGGCVAGAAATLAPGCYTSIASSVTNLTAGIYYVTGLVDIGNLTGTNVMIYLTGAGHIQSGNNNELHLTAPTSGTYAGIAIFQDPADTNNFDSGNAFTFDVNGAIYMPGTDVDIANHIDFIGTGCTLFIAKSLQVRNGNGSLSVLGCAATYSGASFLSASIVQ